MKRMAFACAAAVAACGEQTAAPAPETETETISATAATTMVTAVDGFSDLGSDVADIALVPVSPPYQSRAIFALEAGGFAVGDLNEVALTSVGGPRVESIAAAPSFVLRGSPLPLVFVAGGELEAPAAYVFFAEEGQLLPAPVQPIAPDLNARAVCVERDGPAIVTFAVVGDTRAERWRVRDTGDDLLTAEFVEEIADGAGARGCVVDGLTTARADAGGEIAGADWTLRGVDDVAVAGRTVYTAASIRGEVDVIRESGAPSSIRVRPGINSPGAAAPFRIAASTANFGGSFGGGVVLVSEGRSVSILALDMIQSTLRANDPS